MTCNFLFLYLLLKLQILIIRFSRNKSPVLFISPSVVIELPEWMGLEGLPWLFTAVQMHLHWGNDGPSPGGSEHTINGLSADAEVHLNT